MSFEAEETPMVPPMVWLFPIAYPEECESSTLMRWWGAADDPRITDSHST